MTVPRLSLLGTGYVGLTTAATFTHLGVPVTCVDIDGKRVAQVKAGRAPFHEPGLEELLRKGLESGLLRATTDAATAVRESDMTFICVGTPSRRDGSIDLRYVQGAARDIGRALKAKNGYHLVVVKSTVVPGTTGGVVIPAVEKASGKRAGRDFGVAMNPEFLREGSAVADALAPDRIVAGRLDERSGAALLELYRSFACPKVVTGIRTAETIKYASNAFLASKVAFANETAVLCDALGVDVYEVMRGVGLDSRIGGKFLRAGAGYGGSCFPKDLKALVAQARAAKVGMPILDAVLKNNERMPAYVVSLASRLLGGLRGKRVALLGLAFKPDTDDVRETRALPILKGLLAGGAAVTVHDPLAVANFRAVAGRLKYREAATVDEALKGADAAIFQTEWEEYRRLDPAIFKNLMARPVVVDGRRTFEPAAVAAAGVVYACVGSGSGKRYR